MADEKRSFFKRSFEILGSTAVGIGKDYTSNLQDLVSDASDIKNTVIRGAVDAKTQFQNMRQGSGPIKGLLNWFFTKENEMDPFSLDDDYDSEFDSGTSFDNDDDEQDDSPKALDVKDAKDIAKGHIGSMYKMASKIAETQVANTAEIITTVNNRTSELLASANNINSTLVGISKKLDILTDYAKARTFNPSAQTRNDNYNSLTNTNGQYTLGSTWAAAKQGIENGNIGTAKSLISTLSQMNALTPENMTRMLFDFTLGSKPFKFLGNQSINTFGENINKAIGQTISDALSNAMDTNIFKKIFGDVKSEPRTNDFRSYIKNEYNRDPAVFDGMTRTSIIKTIPEYLKKIYESISGKTMNVGKHGQLTTGEGNTFKALATEAMSYNSGFDSDVLSGFMDSGYGKGSELKSQYDANTVGKLLTVAYISLMIQNDIRVIDKKYINPHDTQLVARVSYYFAMNQGWYTDSGAVDYQRAFPIIQGMLSYVNSNRGVLNRVVGNINYAYEEFRRKMQSGVSGVNDMEHVGPIGYDMTNSVLENLTSQRHRTPYTPPKKFGDEHDTIPSFLGNVEGSGDITRVYGGNNGDGNRTFIDTLNDIRNLLAASTKSLIGSDAYSKVEAHLSKPTVASNVKGPTIYEMDKLDMEEKKREDYSNIDTSGSFKQFMTGFKSDADANFRMAVSPNGEETGISNLYNQGKEFAGNAYNKVYNKAVDIKNSQFVQNALTTGFNRVEKLRDLTKEQIENIGNKLQDTAYGLSVKKSLHGLGNSKEDEEDRNTVSMISAFMQTAMQSGSASSDEKNSIQRLIDSIHNQQLRQKMTKSVNTMLDRASVKSDINTSDGKKGIFGKILSAIGLILSPVKLMSKAVTFILPKIFTGIQKYTQLFNFKKDFNNIKDALGNLKTGIGEYVGARKDYRNEKKQQKIDERAKPLKTKYMQTGKDGSFSYNYTFVDNPGFDTGYENDYSNFFGSNTKRAINNVGKIQNREQDTLLKEMIRRDEEEKREALKELNERKKALKDQQKKDKDKDSGDGWLAGFKQGFGETFKGLGTFSDFKQSFKEAAGLVTKKVTVDGVDGEAESFTDRILAKFMNIFTGKEESVFKKIEENTKEEENQGIIGNTLTGENKTETGNVVENAVEIAGAVKENGGTAGKALAGSTATTSAVANAASGATGVAGKALSTIGKIGASVGKIAGSLGTIGLAVAKIVVKATMMLSGFKALMSTIGSVTTELTKVVKIGLEPLNKIFHALNKVLKPLIKTISTFMKKVMKAISTVVSGIVDTIIPLLNGVIKPVMDMIGPTLDVIVKTITPIMEILSGLAEVVFIPIGGLIKYSITPTVKEIANTLNIVVGAIEVMTGVVLKGLGHIVAAIGIIGKIFGANKLYDSGMSMASSGDQMMTQGWADMKNGVTSLIDTAIKAFNFVDQTDTTENTHIKNPNAVEVNSIGSVMDGTVASGDTKNIYGSGNRSQGSYGGALDIANNGCGPLALADAASRRSGSKVDGYTMASRMARSGAYEPGRGTSVGSFVSAANSMGMGLRPGGVTAQSLKYASPTNPITVIGSGTDFGTRRGNNHYMNVIGTDGKGGAYVSNPLTGRVDRKSASTLAGSSILGLYGRGDSDYYTLPETITEAMSELKNLTSSILGMFTKSASDEMADSMNEYDAKSQMESIRNSINNSKNDQYNGKTYEDIEAEAREAAMTDFESKYPRQAGETEDAYKQRFEKWYTSSSSRQLKYMSEAGAYEVAEKAMNHRQTSITGAFDSITSGFSNAATQIQESFDTAKEYGTSSSSGSNAGGGTISADTGAVLFTKKYSPTITKTNITNGGNTPKMESPLHEFFSMMSGNQSDSSNSSNTGGWYKGYNKPVSSEGVSSSGGHEGIDFNWSTGSDGKPLYATTDGTVISAGWSDTAGNNIKWKDKGGYYHWYMHMRDLPSKQTNDEINGGDLLGFVGNTGASQGAHLHYSIHSQNPAWSSDFTVNPLMYFKNYKPPTVSGMKGSTEEEKIFSYLVSQGMTPIGAAGLLGCFKYESNLQSNNLENTYNSLFGLSDAEYTARVNSGEESEADFVSGRNHPEKVGYGIAQFTSSNLKQGLYNNTIKAGKGIDYLPAQLDSIIQVLKERNIYDIINNASTPTDANKTFLHKYEAGTAYSSDEQVVAAYPWMGWEGVNNRHQYAEDVYNRLKDWVFESDSSEVNSSLSAANINSAGDERMFKNQKHVGFNSGKAYGNIETGSSGKDGVEMFSGPYAGTQPITRIPKNTRVYAEYDGNNGWVKVTYNGSTGYIKSQYFRGTEDATQTSSHTSLSDMVKEMRANNIASTVSKVGNSIGSVDLSKGKNPTKNFGFDIWQSAQYRKLGTSGNAVSKRTDAFKYLADLSADAFNQSSVRYNQSFRDDWYIPGGKDTEQLSNWAGWSLDYNNWNTNPNKYASEFPKELKALKKVYGMGDTNQSIIPPLSDDFMDKVNQFNSISNIPQNPTINHIQVTTNDIDADKRLNAILNNTYKVREERVEYLLERILDKLDDKNDPSGIGGNNTSSVDDMFDNNYIPNAVERLSRG